MPPLMADTIVALATPPGEGGIGIVRLSGPEALLYVAAIFTPSRLPSFAHAQSRRFYYGWVAEPGSKQPVDEVLVVWMQRPTTYTGEDIVEIQGHGGLVPLQQILRLCLEQGARLAQPGEFTQRAFLHGRLDLTQAEAVMDLIQARSSAQSRQALEQLQGALGQHVLRQSQKVLQLLAQLEAWIDFSDEVGELDTLSLQESLQLLCQELQQLLATEQQGKVLRQGLNVALMGLPNVGKSSLLNALLGEERAIVSEYAGTTRDMLEEQVIVAGIPLRLRDTAGLRSSADPLEQLGVARTQRALDEAQLLLLVLDSSRPLHPEEVTLCQMASSRPMVVVLNKSDLPQQLDQEELLALLPTGTPTVATAVRLAYEATGLEQLRLALGKVLPAIQEKGELPLLTRQRHVQGVRQAWEHLRQGLQTLHSGLPLDCLSVDLRAAWTALAELTGEVSSADIAEAIFRDFCIGK